MSNQFLVEAGRSHISEPLLGVVGLLHHLVLVVRGGDLRGLSKKVVLGREDLQDIVRQAGQVREGGLGVGCNPGRHRIAAVQLRQGYGDG